MEFKTCTVFILMLSLVGLLDAQKLKPRIMGGTDCDINKHPYFVYVRSNNANGLGMSCGGTIISRRYVLTAAHCVYGKDECFILTEPSRMKGHPFYDFKKLIYVRRMIIHHKFNQKNYKYDLALLELNENVPMNMAVKLISDMLMKELMYKDDAVAETMGYGANAIVSGEYKFDYNKTFQCLETLIPNWKECSLETIPSVMLCSVFTATKGALKGDSGGPLMYRGKLVGVVSFGRFLETRVYTIYARVDVASGWIAEYVDLEKLGLPSQFSSRSLKTTFFTTNLVYISTYILLLYMYIKE